MLIGTEVGPPAKPQERLLLSLLPDLATGRLVCNTVGRAQFAAAYAKHSPQFPAVCWFLDLYHLQQSQLALTAKPTNLVLECQPDPPAGEFDLVVWILSRQGSSELVRDMLQTAHEQLAMGAQLVAAVDNPRDHWLHERLQELFHKVTRRPVETGVVYMATKTAPLDKLKNYAAEFSFRDGERLIQLRTQPGVFSHRELDGGARALMKAMSISPRMKVLDLGCGSGAVGLAAALRASDVYVVAIDSNPRAIESTRWAATRNNADHLTATLDCDGASVATGVYDLVLANPPYYSDFRIARLFLNVASRALRAGGQLLLVTKTPAWYAENFPAEYAEVTSRPIGNYTVITARRA
jgi:16S rRNA (guanine1207-N2)-methyltransferase